MKGGRRGTDADESKSGDFHPVVISGDLRGFTVIYGDLRGYDRGIRSPFCVHVYRGTCNAKDDANLVAPGVPI